MAVASNDRRGCCGSLRERNGAEGLSAVVARSLRDEVEDVLRQAIWRGDLRPGDTQRSCPRRAARREPPPLREVIRTLEAEGWLCPSRRGAYVKQLSGDDVLEIYSVRCTLEAMAADLVIDKSAAGVTNMLEEKLRELEQESLSHADLRM